MRKTILLVDDQADVRRILKRMLSSLGYAVLAAEGGDEALSLEREHEDRIDVLLTDLEMPGMDGRQLAAEVRRRRPDIGVLFLSGQPDDLAPDIRGDQNESDFLLKPCTMNELSRSLSRLIEGLSL
ncbi:MAG: response regulator [Vicinamibacterales bacterium]|nr:response regulator [Vicinamibacterales bacterium]